MKKIIMLFMIPMAAMSADLDSCCFYAKQKLSGADSTCGTRFSMERKFEKQIKGTVGLNSKVATLNIGQKRTQLIATKFGVTVRSKAGVVESDGGLNCYAYEKNNSGKIKLAGGSVGPVPNPNPYPVPNPYPGNFDETFLADCHMDDDYSFDYNISVQKDLRGKSLVGLQRNCEELAYAYFGNIYTAKLARVRYSKNPSPSDRYKADCHIDDDFSFDYNIQVIRGVIAGSVEQLAYKCRRYSKAIHKQANSSAIANIKFIGNLSYNDRFEATCHVDDDFSFDYNIVTFKIYGQSPIALRQQCESSGRAMFPNAFTIRLAQIKSLL